MQCETDFHQAKRIGSAKSGLFHWLAQRITAVALIPLGIWFVSNFILYLAASYKDAHQWLTSPWAATFAILFVVITFYHGYLGMQVIEEDYIPQHRVRCTLIITKLFSITMAFLCIVSILKILLS